MNPIFLFSDIARILWLVCMQATVLGAVALAVDLAVRGLSARFRFWLWFVVLARLCIPLPLSLPEQVQEFLTGWMKSEKTAMEQLLPPTDPSEYMFEPLPGESSEPPMILDAPPLEKGFQLPDIPIATAAGMLWLAGVIALTAVIALRTRRVLDMVRTSVPMARKDIAGLIHRLASGMGIRGHVEVRAVDDALLATPAAVGALRPRILLPRSMAVGWTEHELTPVLLHELAHIRRRDLWLNWLQIALQTVWFFHPAVWYANHRLRRLREELCDDLAVAHGNLTSAAYSRSILKVMEHIASQPSFGLLGVCIAERKSGAEQRIRRLMAAGYHGALRLGFRGGTALMMVALIGLAVSCAIGGRTEDPADSGNIKKSTVYLANAWGAQLMPPDDLKRALVNLSDAVNRFTNIETKVDRHLYLDDPRIFDIPFVYVTIDKPFKLTEFEAQNFGNYLRNGGFALVENAVPELEYGEAETSLRQALRDALGEDAKFAPIPDDHPLYHCFFDFEEPPAGSARRIPGLTVPPNEMSPRDTPSVLRNPLYLEGIWIDGRLVAIYSDFGYGAIWAEPIDTLVLGENMRQIEIGVNMVVFALGQRGGIGQRMMLEEQLGEGNDYIHANEAYDNRRFEVAVKYYNSFIENQPESAFVPDALYYLADSYYNLGDISNATKTFDRLIDNYPDSSRRSLAMQTKAFALWDWGKPWEAMAEFQKITEQYRGASASSAAYQIGEIYYREGYYEQALEQYEYVVKSGSQLDAQKALAQIEEIRNQLESNPAEESGQATPPRRAAAGTNDPLVIMGGLSGIFDPAGYPLTAEQREYIVSNFPPDNDFRTIFGVLTREQKQAFVDDINAKLAKGGGDPLNDEQVRQYMEYGPGSTVDFGGITTPAQDEAMRNAITSRPDSAGVRPPNMNLIITRPRAGIQTDSLNNRGISDNGSSTNPPPGSENVGGELEFNHGIEEYNRARLARAVEIFERLIAEHPETQLMPDTLFHLGDSLFNLGELSRAVDVFDQLIEKYPGYSRITEAMYISIMAHKALNEFGPAMVLAQRIVDTYPYKEQAPIAAYQLGELYYRQRRYAEALELFKMVVEKYPDNKEALASAEQLIPSTERLSNSSGNQRSRQPWENPTTASSPTYDPRVVMGGMQELFEPAGCPLSDEQIKYIEENLRDAAGLKVLYGMLTQRQKRVIVENLQASLQKVGKSLTEEQVQGIMNYGPDSPVVLDSLISPELNNDILRGNLLNTYGQ